MSIDNYFTSLARVSDKELKKENERKIKVIAELETERERLQEDLERIKRQLDSVEGDRYNAMKKLSMITSELIKRERMRG